MLWRLKTPKFNLHDPGPAALALGQPHLITIVVFNSNEKSSVQELWLTKAATSCISTW